MIRNTAFQEDFAKYRFNNFCSKSIVMVFVVLTTAGIYWKKKRLSNKIEDHQRNVLTLNQTLGVIFLIYCNNVILDYLLAIFQPSDLVFLLEELRVLIVENVLTKCLIPIFLILNTRRQLPSLWTNNEIKKTDFYMTKPTSHSFITQPPVEKGKAYEAGATLKNFCSELRRSAVSQLPEIEIWTVKTGPTPNCLSHISFSSSSRQCCQ